MGNLLVFEGPEPAYLKVGNCKADGLVMNENSGLAIDRGGGNQYNAAWRNLHDELRTRFQEFLTGSLWPPLLGRVRLSADNYVKSQPRRFIEPRAVGASAHGFLFCRARVSNGLRTQESQSKKSREP